MGSFVWSENDVPFNGDYDGSIVAILERLRLTADLEGVAVLDMTEDAVDTPVAYCLGMTGTQTTEIGQKLLAACPNRPSHTITPDKRPMIACPWILPPSRPGGVLMWRAPRSRAWIDADHDLVATMIMLLRYAIGAGMGQPGIDRLTSLPNRRWFLDEGDRYIDRLDRDGLVGTLLLIDVDDLAGVNVARRRQDGDRILVRMSSHLRSIVRPSDIVARVGPDELALWVNGMDHLTAAERADALCSGQWFQDLPNSQLVTVSIGIASRRPGSTEDIRTLLRRAHVAAGEVKTKGGNGWRVSHQQPIWRCSGSSA